MDVEVKYSKLTFTPDEVKLLKGLFHFLIFVLVTGRYLNYHGPFQNKFLFIMTNEYTLQNEKDL